MVSRRVDERIEPLQLGLKSCEAAQDTLVGIELMPMIKKKQVRVEPRDEGLTAANSSPLWPRHSSIDLAHCPLLTSSARYATPPLEESERQRGLRP